MTRSIVLRFASTCFDCGRSLPAGTTARWFGKGRVSCCGAPTPKPIDPPRAAGPNDETSLPPGLRNGPSSAFRATGPALPGQLAPVSATLPAHLATALACGLQAATLAELATVAPNTKLVVRLQSGARLMVPAEHAAHVIRCITESMVDRIRDVMGAAS